MMSKNLTYLLEEQIKKSTEFWAGKPKMTKDELNAVEDFAKEKGKLFEKVFTSPDSVEKVKRMHKEA